MDTGVIAVIGLCVLLALWYGGGHLYNRNRGQRLFRWEIPYHPRVSKNMHRL